MHPPLLSPLASQSRGRLALPWSLTAKPINHLPRLRTQQRALEHRGETPPTNEGQPPRKSIWLSSGCYPHRRCIPYACLWHRTVIHKQARSASHRVGASRDHYKGAQAAWAIRFRGNKHWFLAQWPHTRSASQAPHSAQHQQSRPAT